MRNKGMRAQRSEVTLELTYLAQFGSHLAVQPDFQFVMNPNTENSRKFQFRRDNVSIGLESWCREIVSKYRNVSK